MVSEANGRRPLQTAIQTSVMANRPQKDSKPLHHQPRSHPGVPCRMNGLARGFHVAALDVMSVNGGGGGVPRRPLSKVPALWHVSRTLDTASWGTSPVLGASSRPPPDVTSSPASLLWVGNQLLHRGARRSSVLHATVPAVRPGGRGPGVCDGAVRRPGRAICPAAAFSEGERGVRGCR